MVRSLRALRERQREEYRDHLLAVAREIVAAEGAEALSMRRLADRLGCAPMSLYGYVRDKHDLLAALAHQGFNALGRRLAAEDGDEPLEALRSVFLSYARLGLEKPDDYRVLFMTPETSTAREAKAPDEIYRGNPAFAVGLDRVRICVAAGLLAGDPHAIATMLWTTVHGAVAAVLTLPAFPFGDRDVYVARVVDWAIDGLRHGRIEPLA